MFTLLGTLSDKLKSPESADIEITERDGKLQAQLTEAARRDIIAQKKDEAVSAPTDASDIRLSRGG